MNLGENTAEIIYITNETGVIESVQDQAWNDFILENADLDLSPSARGLLFPAVLGRSLFEHIGDVKVQSFYRHIMIMVIYPKTYLTKI